MPKEGIVFVRHAYINNLHHYLIVSWDNEDNSWGVGIAALPSKKLARKYAGGYFPTKEKCAETTNLGSGVRISWFLHELEDIMSVSNRKYGVQAWDACAVDNRRHNVYKYILGKRGWREFPYYDYDAKEIKSLMRIYK